MRILIILALLFGYATATADSHSAGPEIIEAFSCTFQDGKDVDDLYASVDQFNELIDQAGSEALSSYFAATVFPFRANVPVDYGWIGSWPDLATMGQGLTDYYANGGETMDERFDAVAGCSSNLWMSATLMENMPDDDATSGEDVVEMYFCTMRPSGSMEAVQGAEDGFVAANGDAPIGVYRWLPMFANTPLDLIYVVVHDTVSDFAEFNSGWLFSDAGQQSNARFNANMNCESGIFTGRVLRQGSDS